MDRNKEEEVFRLLFGEKVGETKVLGLLDRVSHLDREVARLRYTVIALTVAVLGQTATVIVHAIPLLLLHSSG